MLGVAKRSIGFGLFVPNVGVFSIPRQTQRSQVTSRTTRQVDIALEANQAVDYDADHHQNVANAVIIECGRICTGFHKFAAYF